MFCLFKGILTCRTIKNKHNLIRSLRKNLLHNILDLLELIHKTHLVVQTSCSIYKNNIRTISLSTLKSIKSHTCWVGAHLLLNNRNPNSFTPNANLLYGSSTESVGSSKIHLLASLLKLISKFTNSSCLTYSIHTYNKNHIRLMIRR